MSVFNDGGLVWERPIVVATSVFALVSKVVVDGGLAQKITTTNNTSVFALVSKIVGVDCNDRLWNDVFDIEFMKHRHRLESIHGWQPLKVFNFNMTFGCVFCHLHNFSIMINFSIDSKFILGLVTNAMQKTL